MSFSESGRYRVSATNDDARTVITILDTESGKEAEVPGLPPGDLAQIRFSRDEKQVALMVSSDTSPNDVYSSIWRRERSARLTKALNPQIKEADLVAAEVVRYKSFDGLEIPAILYVRKALRQQPRCRRWCGCMAGPAAKAAPVTRRRCNIS